MRPSAQPTCDQHRFACTWLDWGGRFGIWRIIGRVLEVTDPDLLHSYNGRVRPQNYASIYLSCLSIPRFAKRLLQDAADNGFRSLTIIICRVSQRCRPIPEIRNAFGYMSRAALHGFGPTFSIQYRCVGKPKRFPESMIIRGRMGYPPSTYWAGGIRGTHPILPLT